MQRLAFLGLISALLLSCNSTKPSQPPSNTTISATVTGMRYVFRPNGHIDSSALSALNIETIMYADAIYTPKGYPLSDTFPANLKNITVLADSQLFILGHPCSTHVDPHANYVVLLFSDVAVVPIKVYKDNGGNASVMTNSIVAEYNSGKLSIPVSLIKHYSNDTTRHFMELSLWPTLTLSNIPEIDTLRRIYQDQPTVATYADSLLGGYHFVPKDNDSVVVETMTFTYNGVTW